MSLMARVDRARSGLQTANDHLSGARGVGKPKNEAPQQPKEKGFFDDISLSGIGHTALDVAGFIPGLGAVADLANAAWYLAEGDKVNAALSAVSAVPGVGDAAAAVRLGVRGANAASDAAGALRYVDDVPRGPRGPGGPGGGENSGPVIFRPRDDWTPEQIEQAREYTARSQEVLERGQLSPTGRVSTQGELRTEASIDAANERARAAAAGDPYGSQHAGHVPDTTWTGKPQPPGGYMPLDPSVNSSLGSQSQRYPIGYKPTEFRFEEGK